MAKPHVDSAWIYALDSSLEEARTTAKFIVANLNEMH